jgi:hypothetical protein
VLHILPKEELWPTGTDADKFLSSRDLWSRTGRTVVFYGDVYFTERAMDKIVFYREPDWTIFLRFGPDDAQGNPQGGECFAQSFYPEDIPEHEAALYRVANDQALTLKGGWEHYRAMNGARDLSKHVRLNRHVIIDDLTDDFDTPKGYVAWKRKYDQSPPEVR